MSRGARLALRGLRAAASNRALRTSYAWLLLLVGAVALLLTGAGLWAVLHLTSLDAEASAWAGIGMFLVRLVGMLVVLIASPLLALLLTNLVLPTFSEVPFLAGLRAVNQKHARALQAQTALSTATTIRINFRRLAGYLLRLGVVLAVSLIPLLGPLLAPALHFYFSAKTVGWELLDPYFSLAGLPYDKQKSTLRAHRAEVLGLGAVYAPILGLPLIGPLFFGVVQAGTAVFVDTVFALPSSAQSDAALPDAALPDAARPNAPPDA